jgi:cysteine synthase A
MKHYEKTGTGGTVAGCGQYLKSVKEDIIVAISDPEGSGLYNKVRVSFQFYPPYPA